MKKDVKMIRSTFFYALIVFVPVSVIYLAISINFSLQENAHKKMVAINNEVNMVSLENEIIAKNLNSLISDISYLSYTYQSSEKDIKKKDFTKLEENWSAFMASKKIYFKLRLIDIDGDERIKIDYLDNGSSVCGPEDLENKSERYYFRDAITMKRDEIYISKLDLNVENSQVEQPLRPVIRLAKTVYDSGDNLEGIIVISYTAEMLLRDFEDISSTSLGNTYLLNSDGHWLNNSVNKDKEWSFMYRDKADVNFFIEHPAVWQKINREKKGTFISERGLYVYSDITPFQMNNAEAGKLQSQSVVAAEDKWIIVSFVPSSGSDIVFDEDLAQITELTVISQKLVLGTIMILSLGFGILLIMIRESREKVRYYSYDPLTKVYNRKAGFEQLQKTCDAVSKKGGNLCVCFIDINDLKRVNDSSGHETGDELLRCVIDVIKRHIRRSDFIIRMGGDEFLIIFVGADVAQAEEIWCQICREYERINKIGKKPFHISVSHGIENFKFGVDEFVEKAIHSADRKMYDEKRNIHDQTQ